MTDNKSTADNELGLWKVSLVVTARSLAACEEALGPVFGAPGHESDDWVAGIKAVSTIPLDPDAEPGPDNLWRLEALCAEVPDVETVQRALAAVIKVFGMEMPEIEIEVVHAIDWI